MRHAKLHKQRLNVLYKQLGRQQLALRDVMDQQQSYELEFLRERKQAQAARDEAEEGEDLPEMPVYAPSKDLKAKYTHCYTDILRLKEVIYLLELSNLGVFKKSMLAKYKLQPKTLIKKGLLSKHQDNATGLWYYTVTLPPGLFTK